MTNTVVITNDVRDTFTLTLGASETLLVAQGAGIYWTGASAITFGATNGGNSIGIYGVVSVQTFNVNSASTITVGAAGSIATGSSMFLNSGTRLTNNGAISIHSDFDTAIRLAGGNNFVLNNGSISGHQGILLGNNFAAGDQVVNAGLISTVNVSVEMRGGSEKFVNSGEITTLGSAVSVQGEFNGSTSVATTMSVTNSGTITSSGGIQSSMAIAGSILTFVNSGTLTGTTSAYHGSGGHDFITNTGIIHGKVDLGAGDDIFNTLGGTLYGTVSGGTGADTYVTDDSRLQVIESGNDIDTVIAACNFRLSSSVEVLNLIGNGDFRGLGNTADNTITGNGGDNVLIGLEGKDTMSGDVGNDRLLGGIATDLLDGGDGDDTLVGNLGNDTLRGFDGDDVLTGGLGKDLMTGGAGADSFVFASITHSAMNLSLTDIITDLDMNDDRIDVSGIDANQNNAAPNDAFTFIGSATFSGTAGELRYSVSGGNTYIEMDVTGDAITDCVIRVNGNFILMAEAFVL